MTPRRGEQECGRAACSAERGQRPGFGGTASLLPSGRALGRVASPLWAPGERWGGGVGGDGI